MSGTYQVDPAGGPGTFPTITAAINSLFVNGIAGPVDLLIHPGTYTESVLVPPIAGTSAQNTVTLKSLQGPGTVQLNGAAGDTFALIGVAFANLRYLVFDGLDFAGAPGHAISATSFVEAIEIRDCTFAPGHRSTAPGEFRHALIVSENSGNEVGWHVHHNRLTIPNRTNRTAYGVYLSNGGGWNFHDNDIDLGGCDYGLWLINNNRRVDTIWNNLFYGSLANSGGTSANSTCAIRADISNYENDFAHNTFAVLIPNQGCCIASGGFGSGTSTVMNRVHGNVFLLLAGGTCLMTDTNGLVRADGNVYWAPAGEIGRVGSTGAGHTTIASWQAATSQEPNSLQADPLLLNPAGSPLDLHPAPNSPVRDAARNTPAVVVTDHDGRLRDAAPDCGAYELSGFALYGTGCAGTAGLVPALGSQGSVALGSTTFAVTLGQGAASSLALLFGGLSRTQSGPVSLPFALGGGCAVLASPDAVRTAFTDPAGATSAGLGIPNRASLVGTNVYFQWAVVDPAAPSTYGVTVSNAGALQL
jgi:hypothetical protein